MKRILRTALGEQAKDVGGSRAKQAPGWPLTLQEQRQGLGKGSARPLKVRETFPETAGPVTCRVPGALFLKGLLEDVFQQMERG